MSRDKKKMRVEPTRTSRDRFSSVTDLLAALLAAPTDMSTWDFSRKKRRYVAVHEDSKTHELLTEIRELLKPKGFFVAFHHSGMATGIHGISVVQPPLIGVFEEYPGVSVIQGADNGVVLFKNQEAPEHAEEIQKVMDGIADIDNAKLVREMARFEKILLHNCFFDEPGRYSQEYEDENLRTLNVRETLLKTWSETMPECLKGSRIC